MAFFDELHTQLRRSLFHVNPQLAWKTPPKTYERMEKIVLPRPRPSSSLLHEALLERCSASEGDSGSALTIEQCGDIFGLGVGMRSPSFRTYPSAGALYPIETYLIGTVEGHDTEAVAFHYDPHAHALEKLWLCAPFSLEELVPGAANLPFSHLIIFTALWGRTAPKYGSVGYNHVLLEAGHLSQNILLVSTDLHLRSCPMSGFNDEKIATVLDIESRQETPIHVITLSS